MSQIQEHNQRPVRLATMFSGMGTLEASLHGWVHHGAVEYDPDIRKAYHAAHGHMPHEDDISVVHPSVLADKLRGCDMLHASPVCKNFSFAGSGVVSDLDHKSADAVAHVIRTLKPNSVTIENAPDYLHSHPFKAIASALDESGYNWDSHKLNASDYGGVSNRTRAIVRASRIGGLPRLPLRRATGDWYQSVKDLVHEAPMDILPDYEKKLYDRKGLSKDVPVIHMGGNGAAAEAGNPAPALVSSKAAVVRVRLPNGNVHRATPRMLARLMGIPDHVVIPHDYHTAKTVIGNGIHGAISRKIIQPMLDISIVNNNPVRPKSGIRISRPGLGE